MKYAANSITDFIEVMINQKLFELACYAYITPPGMFYLLEGKKRELDSFINFIEKEFLAT
jgi:hypothetical protein